MYEQGGSGMVYAPRYSTVLIPAVLLPFLLATLGSVNAQAGGIEVAWLFTINPGHRLTFP
jgi:hypothetical protein